MASKNPPSEEGRPQPAGRRSESPDLAAWLAQQRWFATKTRRITDLAYGDVIPIEAGRVVIAVVTLDDGSVDRYAIPLTDAADLRDGLDDAGVCRSLLSLIEQKRTVRGDRGEIRGARTSAFPATLPTDLAPKKIGGEQSNTSVIFGRTAIVKHFRRLATGENPEVEMTRFLTERTTFRHAPRLYGHLDYRSGDGTCATLAVAQEVVTDARDGWEWMLRELAALYERAKTLGRVPDDAAVRDASGPMLVAVRRLATRTAELHRALASDPHDPDFAPEPITHVDIARWAEAIQHQVSAALAVLPNAEPIGAHVVSRGLGMLFGRQKSRHHGDYHLGQTLYRTETADFVIIDFEGEPLRPLAERRRKHTPLRDVAGMLRSIDYASATGVPEGLGAWSRAWRAAAERDFVTAYRDAAAGAGFMPESDAAFDAAVAVFELEKAAYEVVYEANQRPAWIGIPARGLERALATITR